MVDPEIRRLVWQASLALERGDPTAAADCLERAALLLRRRKEGQQTEQTQPGMPRR
jgi:hypothetical protein